MASQIRCGSAATQMNDQYVGLSVSDARRRLSRDLSIPENAPAVVSRDGGQNTVPVPESYKIQHGDLLEFVRPSGTKG